MTMPMGGGPAPERHDDVVSMLAYVQDKIATTWDAHSKLHDVTLQRYDEAIQSIRNAHDEADRRYDARFEALVKAFDEADKRFEQRFIAQQEAIQAALLAQKEAVNAALVAADRAVVKAETASEKRFDAVNEFRATLADQAASLMPRSEAEARIAALSEKLTEQVSSSRDQHDRLREQHQTDLVLTRDEFQKAMVALTTAQNLATGRDHGIGQSWVYLIGAVALIAAIADILSRLIK